MKEILISGYYGFQNNGDDALLLSIINDLKKTLPDALPVVLSRSPKETEKIYGVKSINRFNIFSIIYHMLKARMLISGGGTLIQDATSTKSLMYYLAIIRIAKMFKLKIMLYANGIGPLRRDSSRKRTKKILDKVDLITLRDDGALKTLETLNITGPEIILTADPVFNLKPSGNGESILKRLGAPSPRIGISVRSWKTLPADFSSVMAEFSDYAFEKYGLNPVLIPMQTKRDMPISMEIAKLTRHKPVIIEETGSINDMLSIVGSMDVCVCMRLHTLIYAAAGSVPQIGLVYDPKISGFMNYMHQNTHIPVEDVSYDILKKLLDNTMADYDSIKADLKENAAVLRKKAELNVKYAKRLYMKGDERNE